jgi:hypothetical protein
MVPWHRGLVGYHTSRAATNATLAQHWQPNKSYLGAEMEALYTYKMWYHRYRLVYHQNRPKYHF